MKTNHLASCTWYALAAYCQNDFSSTSPNRLAKSNRCINLKNNILKFIKSKFTWFLISRIGEQISAIIAMQSWRSASNEWVHPIGHLHEDCRVRLRRVRELQAECKIRTESTLKAFLRQAGDKNWPPKLEFFYKSRITVHKLQTHSKYLQRTRIARHARFVIFNHEDLHTVRNFE